MRFERFKYLIYLALFMTARAVSAKSNCMHLTLVIDQQTKYACL